MAVQAPIYRFDVYELRLGTRRLFKQGIRLKLRPQPFRILTTLVQRAGDAVTREELRELLWSKETFVDFEHGLNTAIKELRAILNDSASAPRYIETVPKVGYRIMVPVDITESALPGSGSVTPTSAISEFPAVVAVRETQGWHLQSFSRSQILLALSVFSVFGVVAYFAWWHPVHSTQANARIALAVLPFENLTGDAGQDYLGDGLTEELISQLGQMDPQHLGVIARTSVMHFKNSHDSLEEIGRTLQVQYALEGTVRHASDQLRVSVQLVDMKGHALWSREYDRENSDLLTIQGEIAREISDEISLKLRGSKTAVPLTATQANQVTNEAHDLYLRGTYSLNKRNVPELQHAVLYFQQAIAKDPNFAVAYAALANSYVLLGGYSGGLQTQYMPKARASALRALQLNGNLPEAHVALAVIAQKYDWDWQTAENEYRKAIELNPNYATAHHWYAEDLAYMGRFDEAFAESERARQIDPLSLIIAADRGVILYYARRYDESIKQFNIVREMEPTFIRGQLIVYPQLEKHLYPEVLKVLEQERPADGESPWYWASMAYVCGRSGREKEAHNALEKVKMLNQHQPLDPGILLWANLGTGNREQIFYWLDKAYSQHSNILTQLKVDPAFDSLRADPRFQQLEQRVGLASN